MMHLSEASTALKAQLIGADAVFTSVGADSRKITTGQLFVALKGEHFDGHDFAEQAIKQGAAAVLVSKQSLAEPAIVVQDTYQALGELAAYWRGKFDIPLAAITGSNGKTTVKEMLASILRAVTKTPEAVLATQGNLNNHIGLPLTMLNLNAQHRYAVLEMGMNHTGEISYLTKLAKPTVALINNAGSAHIGELGSLEAIAKAKGEIFEGLADDGIAVINADDDFAPLWKTLIGQRKTISFGLKNTADVTASYELQADASVMNIKTPKGQFSTLLPTPGLHNVMNALAATSAALAMGVEFPAIAEGLQSYAGVKGRLQHLKGQNGALLIDDTYNANPLSMKAAIDVLKAKSGEKLLVLGDMGELGDDTADLHAEIGRYAKAAGVDALFTLGTLSQNMTDAFGAGAKHYQSSEALTEALKAQLQPTSVVLVKGSRFMAMERIVKEIITDRKTDKQEEAH